jgi:two-component system, NtrC family, sensor kinase
LPATSELAAAARPVSPPTLRRELLGGLVLVFAGALLVAQLGVLLLLPRFHTFGQAAGYLTLLLIADVAVFALFGSYLLQRRVVVPLEALVQDLEAIAGGDYGARLSAGGPAEIGRLAGAANHMASRLISHRDDLAANVRSLEETNRQLTEARDELVRVEKMASVGRLAAGIAHEIGNPLGAIVGYLALLGRTTDEAKRDLAAAAEQEARRIDRIVHGLLDYARPHEARNQTLQANDVVEQTVELLTVQGRLARVEVQSELDRTLPPVSADPYRLQQVVVNLLLNATDALEHTDPAAIRITTRAGTHRVEPLLPSRRKDDPPDVDYSHRRRFNRPARLPRESPFAHGAAVVEIVVTDNGPGIPPELVDQIFEPFVTTKEPGKGTGLGLAVAARLIDAMGGTIQAANVPGSGARFTILLPATPGETPPAAHEAHQA